MGRVWQFAVPAPFSQSSNQQIQSPSSLLHEAVTVRFNNEAKTYFANFNLGSRRRQFGFEHFSVLRGQRRKRQTQRNLRWCVGPFNLGAWSLSPCWSKERVNV